MKEQLISCETAKLAKEKGFNLSSPAYYSCDEPASGREGNQLSIRTWITWEDLGNEDSQEGTLIYSAPTQSMLQKWLRERFSILICISHKILVAPGNASVKYTSNTDKGKWNDLWYNTYEEALEVALQECLRHYVKNT